MKNYGIIGSRKFNDGNILEDVIKEVISKDGEPKNIISGGAIGADTLAYDWAVKNGVETIIFEPRYKDFPKKVRRWMAPKERNTDIVKNSDVLVAFWDMESTGTLDSITKAIDLNKKVYLYNIKENKTILYNNPE